jgi:hypothetical protein
MLYFLENNKYKSDHNDKHTLKKREREAFFFFFPQVESPILKNKEKRRIK